MTRHGIRRRPGSIPGRRSAVLAAVLSAGLLAATPAVAVAYDQSTPLVDATVEGAAGATPASVSVEDLLNGSCPLYSGPSTMDEYGLNGLVAEPLATDTWSLETIIACLQPKITAQVTGVTVIDSDGYPEDGPDSQLVPADLAAPSDFRNTAEAPVVQYTGANAQYDRPWRGGSDLNFLDEVVEAPPIQIDILTGPPLTVTATASATTVTAGDTVDFSAAVSGENGSALSYAWSFDGGAPNSTQASPQVTFDTPGTWTVNLQVTDAAGGGGGAQLTVTVNSTGSATTPTSTGTTTTGPNASTGTTPGAPAGSTKKTGTTTTGGSSKTKTKTKTTTPARTTTRTPSHHATTTSTTTTPAATTTTATSPSGTTAGGAAAGGGSSADTTTTAAAPTPTTAPAPTKAPPTASHTAPAPRPAAHGPLVTGQLISDVVTLPASESPFVHVVAAPTASAPAREAAPSPSPLGIIGAGLAIAALLGLGAGRELHRPRRALSG